MLKQKYFLLLLFICAGFRFSLAQSDTVQIVSPQHFNRILHLNPDAELIDIRAKKEFKKGHIKGALSAEKSEILFQLIDSLGSHKVYLIYCKYGERSISAGKMIYEKYGIHVVSLEDGLDYWKESGFEVVK